MAKPKIKDFGLQTDTDRTVYATWEWNKSNTKEYRTVWYYATGDGVWFVGNDSKVSIKQDAYTAPTNATKVKFKVKPIAKKENKNGKETTPWTPQWSTVKTYSFKNNPPDTPAVPTVTISKYVLTAELDTYDTKTKAIQFEVVKNDSKKVKTGIAKVVKNHVSWTCDVTAGNEYKVRCRALAANVSGLASTALGSNASGLASTEITSIGALEGDLSDWTAYSDNVGTGPAAPAGWVSLKALSETEIQLDWKNVKNATSYEIQYTTKKRYFDSSNEVQSMTVDSVVGHAEVTGLESGMEYFFRVRAVNDQGNSAWTEIASCIVGKKPAVPTTWSSSTTVVVGKDLVLYWTHNSEDGSTMKKADLELTIGGETSIEELDYSSETEEEQEKTHSKTIDTSAYEEGTKIEWRVRTYGILAEASDWSVLRTVDIYAQPTLELTLTNSNEESIDTIESFPFYISGVAGPSTQKAIGYYLTVTANDAYETVDQIGNTKIVSKGEAVFAKNFDISEDLFVEMSASNIDLENNVTYTVTCLVSMDSGLTTEESLGFTVSWTDVAYEPDAEIGINEDDVSAYIRPYAEEVIEPDEITLVRSWTSVSVLTYSFYHCSVVVYNDEIHILSNPSNYKHHKWNGITWVEVSTLPDSFFNGSAVVYNNEIHILGGDENRTAHYKWDGSSWTEVSTLPYSFLGASAVIYNNEIHILGSSNSYYRTAHYKWDGSSWTEVSTLPYSFYNASAVIYNNEIHILGGGNKAHYKWDGTSWTTVSTLPYNFYGGSAVILDNEIHILGGSSSKYSHYKWDGTSWTTVSTLIYSFYYGSAVVYNNGIHIFGSYDTDGLYAHYVYDYVYESGDWTEVSTLPYSVDRAGKVVLNGELHIFGSNWTETEGKKHYKWDGTSWTEVSTLPYSYHGNAVLYNNEIHILGGGYYAITQTDNGEDACSVHYKWNGTSWTKVSDLPYPDQGTALIVVYNNEIHRLGGNTTDDTTHKYDHYKWDGSTWIKVSTVPVEATNCCCVVYNNEIHIVGGGTSWNGISETGMGSHYKWDGTSWTYVSRAPYMLCASDGLVYNNEIHIMGGNYRDKSYKYHYKWDGKKWSFVSTLPYNFAYDKCIIYKDKLQMLGTGYYDAPSTTKHYEFTPKIIEPVITYPPLTLSVYRREFDGTFVELATGIQNGSDTFVTDPHPALDYARYRIVATDNATGAVSYYDVPGYPVGEKAIIIQWDESWSNFDTTSEDELEEPPWSGSLLKLPYNIDVSDTYSTDVELVEYEGRRNPVSYYGTQIGSTSSWSVDIPKSDKDTLYALRRLAVYMGDVYVREPSGSGYWATLNVSFSQTHCETVIPVTLDITRVEGGV